MFIDNRISDSLHTFENVSALIIAIFSERDLLVEQAFEKLANPTIENFRLEETDYIDMVNLRDSGMKLKDIASIYSVDISHISKIIRRQRKRI